MAIDRKLLWKAWPEGFLPMRGASTVGGWVCIRTPADCRYANPREWHFFAPFPVFRAGQHEASSTRRLEGDEAMEGVRQQGDPLPNVDPTDVATWACLLQDLEQALLAQSAGVPSDHIPGGLLWRPHRGERWILEDVNGNIGHVNLDERAVDPAMALVRARIQLRETS